ncbi:MAG: hypothetical protein CM15mP83_4790 [Flavobacteriaceae bacterium]|nr:MAG: hypothetical protein CM15mP83_4790 [Flavobacteriaceae bacterium]
MKLVSSRNFPSFPRQIIKGVYAEYSETPYDETYKTRAQLGPTQIPFRP